jgi:hypothetical protein
MTSKFRLRLAAADGGSDSALCGTALRGPPPTGGPQTAVSLLIPSGVLNF